MFDLTSIFSSIGKYADTIGNITQGITAVQSYFADRQAAKQTKKANAAMMRAAQTEAELTRQDAAQRAVAARRDAMKFRAQQISSFLKSGVTLDGSPMLVTEETANQGQQNASNIITNADYSAKSMLLRAEASKQQVKKADIWGTAFNVLGSVSKAKAAYDKAQNGG